MKAGRQWRFYRADIERFPRGEKPRIELPADIGPLVAALGEALRRAGGNVPATAAAGPLAAIVREWKGPAACDVNETAKPQDGRMLVDASEAVPALGGRRVDLRVCFVPSALGESLTCRIPDQGSILMSLDDLPYSPDDRERLKRAARLPHGILL